MRMVFIYEHPPPDHIGKTNEMVWEVQDAKMVTGT